MKPPICEICGKRNVKHLVYFKLSLLEQVMEHFRNFPHHLPNAIWLYDKHFNILKRVNYNNMTTVEAIRYISTHETH